MSDKHGSSCGLLNISALFTSNVISRFTSHLSLSRQRSFPLTPFLTLFFFLTHTFLFTLYLRDLHPLATFNRHQKLNHTLSTCEERRRAAPLSSLMPFAVLRKKGEIYGRWDRWGMNNGQKAVQGYLAGCGRERGGEIDVTRDTLSSQFPPQLSYLSCVGRPGRAVSTRAERGLGQISPGES